MAETNQDALLAREYRKTATITAVQWWKDGDHPAVIRKADRNRYADEGIPWIETLEGGHIVTPGDWIATGIKGEHWPIKPDVFAATYEPVRTPSDAFNRPGDPSEEVWNEWTSDAVETRAPVGEDQIKHMVNRFLAWRLPETFNPDAGISFKPDFNEDTPWPMKHQPVGTNLFDATQAEAMVRHMLEGLPPYEWEGPLTDEEQAMIDSAWEKHKAAAQPATRAPVGKAMEYDYARGDQRVRTIKPSSDVFTVAEGWTETPLYAHPSPEAADQAAWALEAHRTIAEQAIEIERLRTALDSFKGEGA